jgi:hypothetical protein
MTQYLVAIHLPDDYDPPVETEAISPDIHALNREMVAAGVRDFRWWPLRGQQREVAAGAARW